MKPVPPSFRALLAALLAVGLGSQATADEPSEQDMQDYSLMLPPSSGMLDMKVRSPKEVRVGDSYTYEVHLSNTTDNYVLHDVKVEQLKADGFTVESSEVMNPNLKSDDKNNKSDESGAGEEQSGQWTIKRLTPGEKRVIKVTASSDQAGASRACVAVTDFTPAICMETQFVQPELNITLMTPDVNPLCEDIEAYVLVENTGQGDLEQFSIREDLPDGLTTPKGESTVKFDPEEAGLEPGLKAGQKRKFRINLRPQEAGTFYLRAVLVPGEGDEVRSARQSIRVTNADLKVAIVGPKAESIKENLNYTISVKNIGDAPAPDSTLALDFPENARVLRASGAADAEPKGEPEDGNTRRAWELGTLEPGDEQEIVVTLKAEEGGMFKQTAIASYICSVGADTAETQVDREAKAYVTTEVISLPALLVEVFDDNDPVKTGNEVVYDVRIRNQGTANDQNVGAKIDVPKQLEFVSAEGPTDVSSDGSTVTIAPAKTLEPKDELQYKIRLKVKDRGEIMFPIAVNSDGLEGTVNEEEPTQLIPGGKATGTARETDTTEETERTDDDN